MDQDLRGISLEGRDLTGWDLSYQDLSNSILRSAELTDAMTLRANLTGADLRTFPGIVDPSAKFPNAIRADGEIRRVDRRLTLRALGFQLPRRFFLDLGDERCLLDELLLHRDELLLHRDDDRPMLVFPRNEEPLQQRQIIRQRGEVDRCRCFLAHRQMIHALWPESFARGRDFWPPLCAGLPTPHLSVRAISITTATCARCQNTSRALALGDAKARQRPQQLFARNLDRRFARVRELKRAALQPFVKNRQALPVVPENLHQLPAAVAKHEQVSRQRIALEKRPHDFGQRVERLPHVDRRGGHPAQQARNLSMYFAEQGEFKPTHIIRDRGTKFTEQFCAILENDGIEFKPIPPRWPNLNPFAERWIQSVKRECLDHFIVFGAAHLRYLIDSYHGWYHRFRPHQELKNLRIGIDKPPDPVESLGPDDVVCHEQLGGLLKHSERNAA